MKCVRDSKSTCVLYLLSLMNRITLKLTDDQHDALVSLVTYAYADNYRNNLLDTDTFDEMADEVFEAKETN